MGVGKGKKKCDRKSLTSMLITDDKELKAVFRYSSKSNFTGIVGQDSMSSTTFLASALFHLAASAISDTHHIVPMSDQAAFCNGRNIRTFM